MKYQKRVSVGQFAKKDEDYKDGDIVTIANEGKKFEGQWGEQDVFLVKFKTGEKNLTFNRTTLNNLIDAYGDESKSWVGKEAKIWLILQNVQGKMVRVTYLSHPDATIDEDGQFTLPKSTKTSRTQEGEIIDTNDIPF